MTPELLASIAGMILSLLASYVPWFSTWYEALNSVLKRLIMLLLLLAIAAASYGLACAGLAPQLNLSLTCDTTGALALFRSFLAAVLANQATYQLTKPTAKG